MMQNRISKYPLLVLLICMAASQTAFGASSRKKTTDKSRFFTKKTSHYLVQTDVSEAYAKELAQHMESIHKEYSRRLNAFKPPKNKKQFRVRVYKTRKSYVQDVGKEHQHSGGLFNPSKDLLISFIGSRSKMDVFRVLNHEGLHQFMHTCVAPGCPLWVNEGMAVFFENSVKVGTGSKMRFDIGEVPIDHLTLLRKYRETDSWMSLRHILLISSQQWHANMGHKINGHLQYAEAWSMVHFLVYGNKKYQAALIKYLKRIQKGYDRKDALEYAFGKDFGSFEKRWLEYLETLEPGPRFICQQNMQYLGVLMLGKTAFFESNAPTIEAFYETCLTGKFGYPRFWRAGMPAKDALKKEKIEFLFHCPDDLDQDTMSYTFTYEADTPASLPTINCKGHHKWNENVLTFIKGEDGKIKTALNEISRKK